MLYRVLLYVNGSLRYLEEKLVVSQTPAAFVQVVLVACFVLPGVVYQFLRERFRGPLPGHRDLGERVLRAVVATIVLDALYVIIFGPVLAMPLRKRSDEWLTAFASNPRSFALVGLLLLVGIPAVAALGFSFLESRRRKSAYLPTPTSWDYAFANRRAGFVRARLKSGRWIGGWYGYNSHASAYPQTPDLFLELGCEMTSDGEFAREVEGSSGLYVQLNEIEVLEFVEAPESQEGTTNGGRGAGVQDSPRGGNPRVSAEESSGWPPTRNWSSTADADANGPPQSEPRAGTSD
ncbi:DUF6338 family protein [Microtetraspora glauca]|uniref:DUF6338 family protein n=1 Tax=Microtetraspora glauca TaxID=1996 RepID=A0ABV3GIH0_MICGL